MVVSGQRLNKNSIMSSGSLSAYAIFDSVSPTENFAALKMLTIDFWSSLEIESGFFILANAEPISNSYVIAKSSASLYSN